MVNERVLVIVPTHDHASTLDLAVASALAQTVGNLDVAIIGDGVGDDTREVIGALMATDDRVRFIDAPKSPSRSERVRHRVISESDAHVVTYLGDDDLFFPTHAELMIELLGSADFAHPLPVFIETDESVAILPCDLSDPRWVELHLRPTFNTVALTGAAHTMELYRRLPQGWVEPPLGRWSDHFFWVQMLSTPGVRVASSSRGTTIKAHATTRRELSSDERRSRLEPWFELVCESGGQQVWDQLVGEAALRAAVGFHLDSLEFEQAVGQLRTTVEEQRRGMEAADQGLEQSSHRIAELESDGNEQRQRLSEVEADLSAAAVDRAALLEAVGELETVMTEHRRQLGDRDLRLELIESSRSWRLARSMSLAVHPVAAARRVRQLLSW